MVLLSSRRLLGHSVEAMPLTSAVPSLARFKNTSSSEQDSWSSSNVNKQALIYFSEKPSEMTMTTDKAGERPIWSRCLHLHSHPFKVSPVFCYIVLNVADCCRSAHRKL